MSDISLFVILSLAYATEQTRRSERLPPRTAWQEMRQEVSLITETIVGQVGVNYSANQVVKL